jgi:hypothetical protein
MGWGRLSSTCALVSILGLTAPVVASQPPTASGETLESQASRIANEIAVDWLGEPTRHTSYGALESNSPAAAERAAQHVIRSWWPGDIADPKADAIINGFAFYLQTRAIERLFDRTYYRTAYGFESRRFLGGHLVWSFKPLRLSRRAVVSRDRYGAAFESLDRWIGTPALQAAMFEVAHLPVDRLNANAIVETISNAAGQDLSWLFTAAESDVNYAVTALSANAVTVERKGSGVFTGRTAARVGDFDSGEALELKVVFADGSSALTTTDGRDPSRTVQFQGPSPVVAAYLDPDRIIAMDGNYLDNSIVPPSPTNVPVTKWAARWVVWLQHTMLSYGFLA